MGCLLHGLIFLWLGRTIWGKWGAYATNPTAGNGIPHAGHLIPDPNVLKVTSGHFPHDRPQVFSRARTAWAKKKSWPTTDVLMTVRASSAHGMSYKKKSGDGHRATRWRKEKVIRQSIQQTRWWSEGWCMSGHSCSNFRIPQNMDSHKCNKPGPLVVFPAETALLDPLFQQIRREEEFLQCRKLENQRDSSPRNQEKKTRCRDIWVATVLHFLWSHVRPSCVSRGALTCSLCSQKRGCSSSATTSVYWPCRCVRVLLPTIGCSMFSHFDAYAWTGKKTYSYKLGFHFLRNRSEWECKSLEQRNPTLIRVGRRYIQLSGACSLVMQSHEAN